MKKHIQVAAALLFHHGKIFATRRGDLPYPYVAHKLEFPGGKIEAGERGEDAVKRELKEELDMDVKVGVCTLVTRSNIPISSLPCLYTNARCCRILR